LTQGFIPASENSSGNGIDQILLYSADLTIITSLRARAPEADDPSERTIRNTTARA